jgi:hypothetical protein
MLRCEQPRDVDIGSIAPQAGVKATLSTAQMFGIAFSEENRVPVSRGLETIVWEFIWRPVWVVYKLCDISSMLGGVVETCSVACTAKPLKRWSMISRGEIQCLRKDT